MRPGRSRDPAQSTILWREFGASAYDLGSFSVALNYTSAVLGLVAYMVWRLVVRPRRWAPVL
jgi:hypothetical protein